MQGMAGREGCARVEAEAPPHIMLPTGTRAVIDYSRDPPTASVRLQVSCWHLQTTARQPKISWIPSLGLLQISHACRA